MYLSSTSRARSFAERERIPADLKTELVAAGFYRIPDTMFVRCHVCTFCFRVTDSTPSDYARTMHFGGCRAAAAYQFYLYSPVFIDSLRLTPNNK